MLALNGHVISVTIPIRPFSTITCIILSPPQGLLGDGGGGQGKKRVRMGRTMGFLVPSPWHHDQGA